VSIVREGGHSDQAEAAIDPKTVRFSMGSLREADKLGSMLESQLRRMAATRAANLGREVVSDDDIGAVAAEVFRSFADDSGRADSPVSSR